MFKKKQKLEYKQALEESFADGRLSSSEVTLLKDLQKKLKLKDQIVTPFHVVHLKKVFERMFANHTLTNTDKEHLEYICKELNIPDNVLLQIYMKALDASFTAALEDHRITPDEESEINRIVTELGITDDQLLAVAGNRGQQYLVYKTLYEIESGKMPAVDYTGYVKKKGEIIHFVVPNVSMYVDKIKTSYAGGSSGVSIRIAKGLSYRVGAHKGNIVKTEVTEKVDEGDLVISNQRLSFTGARKNQVSIIKNIIHFELFSDGLKLSVSNRQGISQYGFDPVYGEIVGLLMSKIIEATEE